jgi:hypothetical protein
MFYFLYKARRISWDEFKYGVGRPIGDFICKREGWEVEVEYVVGILKHKGLQPMLKCAVYLTINMCMRYN